MLKYLGTETQIYWTRSQLILIANVALLGFGLASIPVTRDVRADKLAVLTTGAVVGVVLCILWLKGLRSGKAWMEHWKSALRQWEQAAFANVNLFGSRPVDLPESASGAARYAAVLFLLIWSLIAGYFAGSLFSN